MIKIESPRIKELVIRHYDGLKDPYEKQFQKYVTSHKFKDVVTATPDKLAEITRDFKTPSKMEKIGKWKKPKSFSQFMVSAYKNFTKWKEHKYNAYKLAEDLSVNVCPYCNRSTTFTIKEGEKPLIRPEFDHFYNKKSHPVLALSFYNLIPSCHTCNSNLKGAEKFTLATHIHPYWDDFHSEFSFELIPNRAPMNETGHFKLGINAASEKARRTLKDFHIETLYQRHKDSVLDQIIKARVYDDALIDAIFQQHKILFETRSDVVRLVTGAIENREEIAKRPLAKLAHDIAVELKRLKNRGIFSNP